MGKPRGEPQKYGEAEFFGKLEGFTGHIVGFLLVPGLQAGDQGESGVKPGILLVLGGVHPRIVGHGDHQPALNTQERPVHQRVRRHVKPDVLHRYQRPLPGEGDPQSAFQRGFLVDAPLCAGGGAGSALVFINQIFHYFRGGGPGVPVSGAEPRVNRSQGCGLIAQKGQSQRFCH
jgi:hypothetical protein